MSRPLVLSLILISAACGDDGGSMISTTDAPATVDAPRPVDARLIDAPAIDAPMIDAPSIDAPPGSIAAACMHACDAIGACVGEPPDTSCYAECGADLADCSAQQVADVDACSTQACGDISNEDTSPIFMCLAAITCVQG